MNYHKEYFKDLRRAVKIIEKIHKISCKHKREKFVAEIDKLTKRNLHRIVNEKLRKEIDQLLKKHLKEYIKDVGYDNLKII